MSKLPSPRRAAGILLLTAMAVAAALAVFGHNGFMRLADLREKRDEIRQENLKLQEQNKDLRRQVEFLHHDARYLERIAREELGLVAPNEIVFRFSQVPDDAAAGKTGPPSNQPDSP